MAEQIVRQTPAEFIEAPAKAYIQELETAVGGLKDLDLSRLYGPQFLAQPGALQTQAEQLASGLGGFQPFLTAAQASTGPQAFPGIPAAVCLSNSASVVSITSC